VIRLILLLIAFLQLFGCFAASGDEETYTKYSSRPDILSVDSHQHDDLGNNWEKLKRAHVEAIAMLLEMYPDRELYFLARDSELLFDAAKIATQKDNRAKLHLHLLNISRANMRDPHLKDYLSQEGISEDSLRSGKKILFVDTGFSGTIPRVIEEDFPKELRKNFQTHLMSSSNIAHPSSRGFLTALNPVAPDLDPGKMHGSIVSYENMERYVGRSNRFLLIDGKWEAVSDQTAKTDSEVSPERARRYMEDLASYFNSNQGDHFLQQKRSEWLSLRRAIETKDAELVKQRLRDIIRKNPTDAFAQAMVRDTLDLLNTNLSDFHFKIEPEDIGLARIEVHASGSNKNALIQKVPDWAAVLEDPSTGIAMMIEHHDYAKIGAIVDALHDQEFFSILASQLSQPPYDLDKKNLLLTLIDKKNISISNAIAISTLTPGNVFAYSDILKALVETGEPSVQEHLLHKVSGHIFDSHMEDFVPLFIAGKNEGVLDTLLDRARLSQEKSYLVRLTQQMLATNDRAVIKRLTSFQLNLGKYEDVRSTIDHLHVPDDRVVFNDILEGLFSRNQRAEAEKTVFHLLKRWEGSPEEQEMLRHVSDSIAKGLNPPAWSTVESDLMRRANQETRHYLMNAKQIACIGQTLTSGH